MTVPIITSRTAATEIVCRSGVCPTRVADSNWVDVVLPGRCPLPEWWRDPTRMAVFK